jgi:GntR family colanic acid and biofilm gene transcriptional regulator
MPAPLYSGKANVKVKPIDKPQDLDRIRELVRSKTRDLLLFDLAVETGVPAKQLLRLRVGDLLGLKVGDRLPSLQRKESRDRPATIGLRSHKTFGQFMVQKKPGLEDYLFKSRKGNGPLSLSSASRLVSGWFKQAGLNGMSGLLSLRKTWECNQDRILRKQPVVKSAGNTESTYIANSIPAKTAQELVYQELEQAIVKGRLKPGEKLVTEKLARQMGTSRIPVREAIGRLEARNFVKVQPKKGVTVSELSERNLKEILEIRLMLELAASMKAAPKSNDDTLRRLEKFNSQYVDAQTKNDADEALRLNKEFHFTIYREAQMPILLSMIQNLWNQVSPYYHIMFRQTLFHDPRTGSICHKKIIEGMAARNPHKVSKWLTTDLADSTKFVISVMRSMQIEEGGH